MLESETISVNFLSLVNLKLINLSYTLSDLLTTMIFVTCIPQLGNMGSLSYADLPNADTFHHLITTNQLSVSPPSSLEKPVGRRKLSRSELQMQLFQNFKYSLESSNVISSNKYYQLFSLTQQVYFVHFWEEICLNYQFVCQSFFQVKLVSNKKDS